MSNFSYDDFAVLVRTFSQNMLTPDSLKSLRIVPLFTAPSMAAAIKGEADLSSEPNIPIGEDGQPVKSNVEVQHNSAGYCRLVGHVVGGESGGGSALGFVLYRTGTDASEGAGTKEVIAVASLKGGFEIGAGCYPAFTITTVNNYQSVAFNPNAFATVEDLKNINGLDGLHIAFDTASGDLKLLDKDGNVLDQANLPIKADVIIADGEEGYKYVKTDKKQDIHAPKAWMPANETAWDPEDAVPYTRQHAALVVGKGSTTASRVFLDIQTNTRYPISKEKVTIDYVLIDNSTYMLGDLGPSKCSLFRVNGNAGVGIYQDVILASESVTIDRTAVHGESPSYPLKSGEVEVDVITDGGTRYVLGAVESSEYQPLSLRDLRGERHGNPGPIEPADDSTEGSSAGGVVGITLDSTTMYTFEGGATTPSEFKNISGTPVTWFGTKTIPEGYTLKYGLEAFVWTVKGADAVSSDTFFGKLNASLLALGFHVGDDIALGTNLSILAPAGGESPLNKVNADEYMHGKGNKALREREVDAQRALAKEELVAWNAQHPALTHNGVAGTRISENGVDIRNGKILIGDGEGFGEGDGKHVQRYELSTNFSSKSADQKDKGLALNVVTDASSGIRNVLTISDAGYISGAPICMDMHGVLDQGEEGLLLVPKRSTSCFDFSMKEAGGTVNITITDNRLNSTGFSGENIVEISPVYISGGSAPEMLPALTTVNTVAGYSSEKPKELTCTCPQIIDWANSVDLSARDSSTGVLVNKLFVIVKVY